MKIFPEFTMTEKQGHLSCETMVRVKGENGVWYLTKHYKTYSHVQNELKCLQDFLLRSYQMLHIMIPTSEIKSIEGLELFIKDEFQGSEQERIQLLIK